MENVTDILIGSALNLQVALRSVTILMTSILPVHVIVVVSLLSRVCFATPWPAAHQAPPSEIFQATILGWVAISFSRGSSQPRD